jgi:hypothetical protein
MNQGLITGYWLKLSQAIKVLYTNKMKDNNEQLKKRLKKAMKIMRKSSKIKYEILRDLHGLDPSHIEEGDSFPKMVTILKYCTICETCPGWLLLLSCQVDLKKISEEEFYYLIENWDRVKWIAELKLNEMIELSRTIDSLFLIGSSGMGEV